MLTGVHTLKLQKRPVFEYLKARCATLAQGGACYFAADGLMGTERLLKKWRDEVVPYQGT